MCGAVDASELLSALVCQVSGNCLQQLSRSPSCLRFLVNSRATDTKPYHSRSVHSISADTKFWRSGYKVPQITEPSTTHISGQCSKALIIWAPSVEHQIVTVLCQVCAEGSMVTSHSSLILTAPTALSCCADPSAKRQKSDKKSKHKHKVHLVVW